MSAPGWLDAYRAAQAAHPDSVVLMRMGDFWEAFDGNAAIVAHACEIALTVRRLPDGGSVRMSGFPVHSRAQYEEALCIDGNDVHFIE